MYHWRSKVIIGITNMFEYLLVNSPEDASEREKQQLLIIATAANETTSLAHHDFYTLPVGERWPERATFLMCTTSRSGGFFGRELA